jgi:hypothetical protein
MTRRVLAVVTWVVTAVLGISMFWTLTAGGFLADMAADQQGMTDDMLTLTFIAIGSIVAVTLSYATVGALLASRPGAGRLSAVLLAGGLLFAAIPFGYVVGGALVLDDPYDPLANAVFLLGPASLTLGYSLILPVLALVFPHGALPSRRWRGPVVIATVMLVVATTITILRPGEIAGTASRNPFGLEAIPAAVIQLGEVLIGVGIVTISVLGTAAVLARYRSAGAIERQQLRWFLAAVLLAIVPIALSPQEGIGGPIWILVASLGLLLVPVSVWIAVTRYRLYEIDRLISRGLSWVALSVLLVLVYAGGILVLQAALGDVTQGNTIVVAASTLLAATLFQPLRARVQRTMDRRFDRARYDGERTAVAFAERLRHQVDLGALQGDVARTVGSALRPRSMAVWIRGDLSEGRR